MAKLNAVKRGRGVMFAGRLASPKLVKKAVNRFYKKAKKVNAILSNCGVLQDRKAERNLMYLYSNGLINA